MEIIKRDDSIRDERERDEDGGGSEDDGDDKNHDGYGCGSQKEARSDTAFRTWSLEDDDGQWK